MSLFRNQKFITIVGVFSLVISTSAHAYLDPATGSMLLQGLLGGIAGAAVFIRVYWSKLTSLFKRDKDNTDK